MMTIGITVASILLGGMSLWVIIRSAVASALDESQRVLSVSFYKALKQMEHDERVARHPSSGHQLRRNAAERMN